MVKKRRGRKIIQQHIEGETRESHHGANNMQHSGLVKPRLGLQIMNTNGILLSLPQ